MMAFLLLLAAAASPAGMFTIRAEVQDSVMLDAAYGNVRAYLNDPDLFRSHFPGMVSIRQLNATQSEWIYEVKPPLSSAQRTTYVVNERHGDKNSVVFETAPGSNDYMFCRASVAARSDTSTSLTIELKLESSREHGSDIHFLAPLFGQDFISARMRDQIKTDITTFFRRISDELRSRK